MTLMAFGGEGLASGELRRNIAAGSGHGGSGLRSRSAHLAAKRLLDVGLAALALLVLSGLFVFIMVLIRLDSRGPALIRQERWGRGMKPIRVLKFRTMYSDKGDLTGRIQTIESDPRVTRVGRVLRRSNLDELPQLWNVLRGDMSLVGPRCHAIGMLAAGVLYEELVPHYHHRHAMRPGITGWAQVNGLRGPTVDPQKAIARVDHDLDYLAKFTIWFDLKILARTVIRELRGGTGF